MPFNSINTNVAAMQAIWAFNAINAEMAEVQEVAAEILALPMSEKKKKTTTRSDAGE